jgi:hypothetical protein
MQHEDDSDEEDLDETEVGYALAAHAADRPQPTEPERAYIESFLGEGQGEGGQGAGEVGIGKGSGGDGLAENGEGTGLNGGKKGSGRAGGGAVDGEGTPRGAGGDSMNPGGEGGDTTVDKMDETMDETVDETVDVSDRLWLSEEGRGRWREALAGAVSVPTVALAITGLRVHCRRFRRLQVRGSTPYGI